jgi:NADPH-dependent curcumin reductase CurA
MIIRDHASRQGEFERDMRAWVRDGRVKTHETIVHGLDRAPAAFLTLFTGEKLGKLIVQVSEDPGRP